MRIYRSERELIMNNRFLLRIFERDEYVRLRSAFILRISLALSYFF